MYKAFKFRLYPTCKQKNFLHKNYGCSRFVYNYHLHDIKTNRFNNSYDCIKNFTNHLKEK